MVEDISDGFNIDLIGFHGQTIYHSPKEKVSSAWEWRLLSQLSKKKLLFNFRKNDIFNGGEECL